MASTQSPVFRSVINLSFSVGVVGSVELIFCDIFINEFVGVIILKEPTDALAVVK